MEQAVTEAVRILREGGVILYPTDTVWGIGCDATNAEAVERIYRLKRSENKKSMLVLCATPDMVVRYVHKAPGIAFEVQELATKPLTLILPGASGVAANLIPEEGTLGVRIPDHAFCQAMLRKLGRPIVFDFGEHLGRSYAPQPGRNLPRDHRRGGLCGQSKIRRQTDGQGLVDPPFQRSRRVQDHPRIKHRQNSGLFLPSTRQRACPDPPPKAATGSCPKRYTLWHESSKLLFKSVFRISTCSST